jgi:2-oxoglutarate ferredoxin oxidoreductase subunit gamma
VEVPENLGTKNVFSYPIIETARITLGKSIVSNIVTLGVFCELTDIYTREELLHAILQRVPKGSEVLNERAFDEGIKLVRRA